ncbi:30S ribosomal protein S20 [Candidatus Aerophobetes bacterium]|nr:30S ribosomal protein S20 [Candidatus Aerophobetes bacterium]
MAKTKSAKKRIRQIEKRTKRNRQIKNFVKTTIKKFLQLLEEKNLEEAKNRLPQVISVIDRAWSKGVWHKNKAAREKAKIMLKFNQAQAEKELSQQTK